MKSFAKGNSEMAWDVESEQLIPEGSLSRVVRNYLNLSTFLFLSPYNFSTSYVSRETKASLVSKFQRVSLK